MFRLDKENGEQKVRITVAGALSSDYVEVLESCCRQAITDGQCVELVLREVMTIDEAGRALLRRLALRGVRMSVKGVYHSYLLDEIRQTANGVDAGCK